MRGEDGGIEESWSLLDGVKVCHMGMLDEEGPYVVPMVFGHERPSVFLHSAKEGRKVEALRRDPRVCLTFVSGAEVLEGDVPCRWGMGFRSVVAEGRASFPQGERRERALRLIFSHVADREPEAMPEADGTLVIEVEVDRISGKRGR